MYYHSTIFKGNLKEITPMGFYEKVDDDGDCPQPLFGDIGAGFPMSKVPESSFSLSIEESVVGGAKTQCNLGKNCLLTIYSTSEEPDIDISDCGYDFSVLEEVRYRRTIPVKKELSIMIKEGLVEQLNSFYGLETEFGDAFIDDVGLSCVKKFVKDQLQSGQKVLKRMDKDSLDECYAIEQGFSSVEEMKSTFDVWYDE